MRARADHGPVQRCARAMRHLMLLASGVTLISACTAGTTGGPTPQLATPTAIAQVPSIPTATITPPTVDGGPVLTPTSARPTSVPVATTPTVEPRLVLIQRVRAALADLRTGHLQVTSDYGGDTQAVVTMQFQLADANSPARPQPALYSQTTYTSPTGNQRSEHLTVGDRSWQRDSEDEPWRPMPDQEGVYGQVTPFLPQLPAPGDPVLGPDQSQSELHWLDRARDADVLLRVDEEGVPQSFRRTAHDGTAVLTVTYTRWNAPVSIPQPPSQ